MVCLGNICRSPIAEGVLKHKAAESELDWTIDSAGTESYHIGEEPHKFSQKICRQNGINISGQKAMQFSKADFAHYDKIYAMAKDVFTEIKRIGGPDADMSKVDYFLNERIAGSNESVPDPWYGSEDGYIAVYQMIDETCDAIIKRYK
ncbi:MAG: low molecular weight phosphotyrosine protein phosphatase [Taibaiella sp.]|nr:low molecular weight phosphotyrosine protein phosphatase [Taibaiella sp.]